MNIQIRPMQETDLPQVVAIENRWLYLSKWGREGYRRVIKDTRIYTCLVAEDIEPDNSPEKPVIAGFAVLALLIEYSELCNIVVTPEYLSMKVGYRLLQRCLEASEHFGTSRILLEVRLSNQRAIRFYEKNGFSIASRRKNYYRNPPEDAWVMELKLPKKNVGLGKSF
jgi:[ribosomal protein S18]-alanine N-acetyltransferase